MNTDFLRRPIPPEPPAVICENCGKQVPASEVIGYSIVVTQPGKRVDGTPMGAWNCWAGSHFGCTIEHARAALLRCLDEHIIPAHQKEQAKTAADVGSGVS